MEPYGALWSPMEPYIDQYGPYIDQYGPYLTNIDPYLTLFDPYWALFDPYWALFGPIWPYLASYLAVSGLLSGRIWVPQVRDPLVYVLTPSPLSVATRHR